MALQLEDRTIQNIRLIDDDLGTRTGYRFHVDDLELNAIEETGPINAVEALLKKMDALHDAVICDLNLKTKNYSPFNGDELVSQFYSHHIPAVLCTRFADELPEPIKHKRRRIPVVLSSSEVNADSIKEAFSMCIQEFAGNFSSQRRPWRAMVRVEGGEAVGGNHYRLNIVLPGWDPKTGLTIVVPAMGVLKEICSRAEKKEIVRAFAQVNLGAEKASDIYIDEWALT